MNMTVQSDFSRAIDRARRRPNRVGVAIFLGTTALIAIGAAKLAGSAAPAQAALPPPGVTVAVPLVRQVNEWDDYIGRFAPSNSVEIRPRVSGALTGIFFTDGEIVR